VTTSADQSKVALAQRMHTIGESASTIASALGVSRATVYRVFPGGKDELLRAAVGWEMGRFFGRLAESVAGAPDFASLVEQPDLNATKLLAVPEHISHGSKIGNGLGVVFNISDLDRVPTATFQPAPIPPKSVKVEDERVIVRVEFIVTADGRVVNVFATGSDDPRFNDAAVNGVGKWKFKPGIKAGRKVNTRMLVPIIFKPPVQDT